MRISEILTPERVAVDLPAGSKKAVLEKLAELISAAVPQLTRVEVFNGLIARERLGSTGLGHGVAIPHCRVNHSDQAIGAVVLSREGVDFDAADNAPCDLFFGLAVPAESTEEHLAVLAQLASLFNEQEFRDSLRRVDSAQELFEFIDKWQTAE